MHQHQHGHHHPESTQNIKIAFFLNLGFTIIEIIGGIFTNSVAILADALHDLGDSFSLGLAWYFQKLSGKGRDEKYSYGYKRFSLLGALVNSIILVVGSVFILSETIPRILHPEETNALGMIGLAILGVLVNGAAVFKLQKGSSMNERVVSLHLLEDVLGWIAVLIGSILIYFFEWFWIDPILSVLINIYVLWNVFKNLKSSLQIILQAIPADTDAQKVEKYLCQLPEIKAIHDLHIWSLDGEYNILTVHLILEKELLFETIQALKTKIRHDLEHLNIEHVTLEFELEECEMMEC